MRWRRALLLLLTATLILSWEFAPDRTEAASQVQITLDGSVLSSDVAPYVRQDLNVTMVPLRVIGEGLGAQVDWVPSIKQVTISQGNTAIRMLAGQKQAEINGTIITLEANAEVAAGRMMVPLRFVSSHLGVGVEWDNKNKIVRLSRKAPSPTPAPSATATPVATPTPVPSTIPAQPTPPAAETELRGVWISTIYNLDYPSVSSYGKQSVQEQEYITLLDEVQAMGMNAVFVQVRPSADALYPSQLVPWSKVLTGKQGKDPAYDPLQFMIEETHRRGMTFHAWFNPFRANTDSNTSQLAANHVAVAHPEWMLSSGSQLIINPGIPEARQHVIDAIMEVVRNYAVDGVHLDDYFYPSNAVLQDDATFKAFNGMKLATKAEWRRSNIDTFVQQLDQAVHAVKPDVSFGISPFGVWRNKSQDSSGSDTRAGVTAYDSMSADVRKWVKQGWLDYVAPQVYWSFSLDAARYDKVVDWWSAEVAGTGVDLYIGHSVYKLGTQEKGWHTSEEIINQLKYNAGHPEVQGDIFFSAKDLRRNPLGIIQALQRYYGL